MGPLRRRLAPPFETDGLTIARASLTRQILISGPRALAQYPDAVGWPDIAMSDMYVLSLRRDRVVAVNGPEMPDGWDDDGGQAVSDVTDAHAVFDIAGKNALDLLKHGTEIAQHQPSRSVARVLCSGWACSCTATEPRTGSACMSRAPRHKPLGRS